LDQAHCAAPGTNCPEMDKLDAENAAPALGRCEMGPLLMPLSLQAPCQMAARRGGRKNSLQGLFISGHYATDVAWRPASTLPSWSTTTRISRSPRAWLCATCSS